MKTLKVWGGLMFGLNDHKQYRTIVAAYTKKQAREMLGIGRHFDGYWCETGNAKELAIATTVGMWANFGRQFDNDAVYVPCKQIHRYITPA